MRMLLRWRFSSALPRQMVMLLGGSGVNWRGGRGLPHWIRIRCDVVSDCKSLEDAGEPGADAYGIFQDARWSCIMLWSVNRVVELSGCLFCRRGSIRTLLVDSCRSELGMGPHVRGGSTLAGLFDRVVGRGLLDFLVMIGGGGHPCLREGIQGLWYGVTVRIRFFWTGIRWGGCFVVIRALT